MKNLFIKLFTSCIIANPLITLISCSNNKDKVEIVTDRNFTKELNEVVSISKALTISLVKKWKVEKVLKKVTSNNLEFYFKDPKLIESLFSNRDKYTEIKKRIKPGEYSQALAFLDDFLNKEEITEEDFVTLLNTVGSFESIIFNNENNIEKIINFLKENKVNINSLYENFSEIIKQFGSQTKIKDIFSNLSKNFQTKENKTFITDIFKKSKDDKKLEIEDIKNLVTKLAPLIFPLVVLICNYNLEDNSKTFQEKINILLEKSYKELIENITKDNSLFLVIKKCIINILNPTSNEFNTFIKIINLEQLPIKIIVDIINEDQEKDEKINVETELKKQISWHKKTIIDNLNQFLPDNVISEFDLKESLETIKDILEKIKDNVDQIKSRLEDKKSGKEEKVLSWVFEQLNIIKKVEKELQLDEIGKKILKIINSKLIKHILNTLLEDFKEEPDINEIFKENVEINSNISKINSNTYHFQIKTYYRGLLSSNKWCIYFKWEFNKNDKTLKIIDASKQQTKSK